MTYDYVCTACGHVWEAEQRITADPLKDCPECHQATAKRQISGGQGFILKGGGWYSDLYSSAKPAAADSAKESKPAATDSKSESKTEAKTQSKPEAKTEKAATPSTSASGTSNSPAASSAS